MDVLFEQRLVQNTALAAEILWQASHETYESSGRTSGMPFPFAFLVLPLCFHKRTVAALCAKTRPGAMYKALAEDREITVGLQTRMEGLAKLTFKGLHIGFCSDLFQMDPSHDKQIVPVRRSPPVEHVTDEVRMQMAAAKRVGQAFAEMSREQIVSQLNIRF